ncbi:MAG: DNA primase, partial [Bacteroidales bacterium]|nr:DNA primase [Bacteroidales bacterium]
MIDQSTIDRIFDTAKIEEVVGDYVTLKRRGANMIGHCPFHNEKTPSFSVSPAKNIYKCFGCGEGGNPVNFIMKIENLSYFEALKFLANKYHIEIVEEELSDEQIQQRGERESLMAVTEALHQQFTTNLFEHPEGTAVGLTYFRHRGFHDDTIRRFQLGYALNQRDAYTNQALKKGYKLEYLEKIGATIVKENYNIDRFHGRAIFPIHSISGKVIAFGGRAIKKDDQVKYQNSPESDIYHKSNVLYGIYFAKNAIVREKKCYLVEGYADVISMFQSGLENVVAPCGTALTVEQIRLLRRILPSVEADRDGAKNVTLLYDGDSAGMNAALKNGKLLLSEGLNVRVVVLPEGEDPDTFAQNNDSTVIKDYL